MVSNKRSLNNKQMCIVMINGPKEECPLTFYLVVIEKGICHDHYTSGFAVKRCIVYCALAGLRPFSDSDNCIFPVRNEIKYLCIVT